MARFYSDRTGQFVPRVSDGVESSFMPSSAEFGMSTWRNPTYFSEGVHWTNGPYFNNGPNNRNSFQPSSGRAYGGGLGPAVGRDYGHNFGPSFVRGFGRNFGPYVGCELGYSFGCDIPHDFKGRLGQQHVEPTVGMLRPNISSQQIGPTIPNGVSNGQVDVGHNFVQNLSESDPVANNVGIESARKNNGFGVAWQTKPQARVFDVGSS